MVDKKNKKSWEWKEACAKLGNDQIKGEQGNDDLTGGAGADTLDGGTGDDVIDGGDGDDTIIAGPGRDYVSAGAGDDTIRVADDNADHVNCGPGEDVVFVEDDAVRDSLYNCETVERVPPEASTDDTSFSLITGTRGAVTAQKQLQPAVLAARCGLTCMHTCAEPYGNANV